jgi:peptidoglycan-associated lipoprotein
MTYEHPTAEACGVKLATKAPKVRRGSVSKNRSKILIVGKKDSTLEKRLRAKKHSVVYASSVDKVKDKHYHLVIADDKQFDAANERFGNTSQVMKKRSSASDTGRTAERLLARRTKSRSGRRKVLLSRNTRKVVERGGTTTGGTNRPVVETGTEGGGTVAARTPSGTGTSRTGRIVGPKARTAAVESGSETKPDERKAVEPKPKAVEPKPKAVEPKPKAVKPKAVEPKPKHDPVENNDAPKPAKNIKWAHEFHFGTNSTNLSAGSRRKLKRNAQWLEQHPSATITIEGHTDTVGDEAYNLDLSERRANVAKDFLLGLGIDESRITVEAKGEQEPAYQPGTSGKNRRIVLVKHE